MDCCVQNLLSVAVSISMATILLRALSSVHAQARQKADRRTACHGATGRTLPVVGKRRLRAVQRSADAQLRNSSRVAQRPNRRRTRARASPPSHDSPGIGVRAPRDTQEKCPYCPPTAMQAAVGDIVLNADRMARRRRRELMQLLDLQSTFILNRLNSHREPLTGAHRYDVARWSERT